MPQTGRVGATWGHTATIRLEPAPPAVHVLLAWLCLLIEAPPDEVAQRVQSRLSVGSIRL
jgi:hypothetical protein